MERKYIHAENCIRCSNKIVNTEELKACNLSNKNKGKLYKSLNNCLKFAVIIDQKKNIGDHKKNKQRYLDYAYKIGLKSCFKHLIDNNIIIPSDIKNINVFVAADIIANKVYYLKTSKTPIISNSNLFVTYFP